MEGHLPQLVCGQAPWRSRRAPRHGGSITHVDVQVDVDVTSALTCHTQGLGHHIADRAPPQGVAGDHRDAEIASARCVFAGVGEVGDADLDDLPAGETGLDQSPHRRSVRGAIAKIVVRIEGDQSGSWQIDMTSLHHRVGDRVVAAQSDQHPCVSEPDCLAHPHLSLRAVRIGDVTEVPHGELRDVDVVGPGVRRVASEHLTDGCRRRIRASGTDGRAMRRDTQHREIDRAGSPSREPLAGARPPRILAHHISPAASGTARAPSARPAESAGPARRSSETSPRCAAHAPCRPLGIAARMRGDGSHPAPRKRDGW